VEAEAVGPPREQFGNIIDQMWIVLELSPMDLVIMDQVHLSFVIGAISLIKGQWAYRQCYMVHEPTFTPS
jgi:hypothetical protein